MSKKKSERPVRNKPLEGVVLAALYVAGRPLTLVDLKKMTTKNEGIKSALLQLRNAGFIQSTMEVRFANPLLGMNYLRSTRVWYLTQGHE